MGDGERSEGTKEGTASETRPGGGGGSETPCGRARQIFTWPAPGWLCGLHRDRLKGAEGANASQLSASWIREGSEAVSCQSGSHAQIGKLCAADGRGRTRCSEPCPSARAQAGSPAGAAYQANAVSEEQMKAPLGPLSLPGPRLDPIRLSRWARRTQALPYTRP
ncbi:hypothetical protein BV20DRAFT_278877 [Pilatotrama ljubarskyi]|nr:hypothetical protein BV20DRAFT_278877 [Pilatotrama ljubarskyi]